MAAPLLARPGSAMFRVLTRITAASVSGIKRCVVDAAVAVRDLSEIDHAGHLVSGDHGLALRYHRLRVGIGARRQGHDCGDGLAPLRIGQADDCGIDNSGQLAQAQLALSRVNVPLTRADNPRERPEPGDGPGSRPAAYVACPVPAIEIAGFVEIGAVVV